MLPKLSKILMLVVPLLVTLLLSAPDTRAQQSSDAGVVVLTNGQVMSGHITHLDNKLILKLDSGSRIHLSPARVMFEASSLEAAYWELAARTRSADIEGQMGVFKWCLRNELFSEAANHLLVLQESQIPARRLAALDIELQTKMNRVEQRLTQRLKLEKQKRLLAKQAQEKADRKRRVESMIGGLKPVFIPDLNRVPLRPIPQAQPNTTGVIDQYGDPVVAAQVRQVNYEQPLDHQAIFSSPAVPAPPIETEVASATGDSATKNNAKETSLVNLPMQQPVVDVQPLTNPGAIGRIPKPPQVRHSAQSVLSAVTNVEPRDPGFTVIRGPADSTGSTNSTDPDDPVGASPTTENTTGSDQMVDPFDADYFNRRFSQPATDQR